MNFAFAVFGKQLNDINYSDLSSYFLIEREESDQIEFKSYVDSGSIDSKVSGLVRSTAAFLNSDGGILIWGAPTGEKIQRGERRVTVFKGELTVLPQEYSDKDWIISKISDKIVPLPAGIRIRVLNDSDKYAVIFEIDKSTYSPHQAEERYFMRLDGQTRVAPHHYVEALFNKVSYAQLEVYLSPNRTVTEGANFRVDVRLFIVNQSLFPHEEGVNVDIKLVGGFFNGTLQASFTYNHPRPLYYGEWVPVYLKMTFSPDMLETWQNIGRIVIFFGGKTAPRKASEYHIDFNPINFSLDNPANNFTIVMENKLQSEIMAEKAVPDEDIFSSLKILRR